MGDEVGSWRLWLLGWLGEGALAFAQGGVPEQSLGIASEEMIAPIPIGYRLSR
jgi:hypothetical protein